MTESTSKSEDNVRIRSEEVQEILSFVPNWMIRWGNTLLLFIIGGLLSITWFVKYPDTISAQIIVTTSIPPERIYAKSSGQLDTILVDDNDEVSKYQLLAIIESTANYKDVLLLKNVIDTLIINYTDFYFPVEELPLLFLGDIQTYYALFEKNYTEYKLNKELKPFSSELLANQLSIKEVRNRLNVLISQQNLNSKELELKKKEFERFETLYKQDVISTQEFNQEQLDYLQAQRSYRSISSSISLLREAINNSQKNLRGIEVKKTQDDSKSLNNVIQSYNQLKRSLKNWQLKYALQSSIDGKVSFLSFWTENQTVNQDDWVFAIIPKGNNSFIGKIRAPAQNSGKIQVGQRVNIRLANYPYKEFGMLEGTVNSISLVPDTDGNYLIEVELPEKLISTYNKEIEFKQEMRGSVEIITEDLRLIERFFYQLKNVFNK